MAEWLTRGMIYLGSLLMVYNICSFVRFARFIRNMKSWSQRNCILYIPIALLVSFLLGYLAVGFFGDPDIIMAGILFGGSIFVFVMYILLNGITRQVIENERLAAELMAAEESSRAKTSFLASMSHEMRTPMNAIIGLDAIAMQDETLQPGTRDRLEKIDGSARHLLGLIDNVLIMNHIDSDDMTLKQEPFSLKKSLEIINVLVQTKCDEKRIACHTEIRGELNEMYLGDDMRLKQALLNILDNAVNFTDEGGSVSFVTELLSSDERRDILRFTIQDTGVGIDPEFLPHIYESFSQEDASTTSRYGGSGLGLAITRKLVDIMEGEIALTSEKGKGTTFIVTLPLARVDRQPEMSEQAAVDLAGRHVLVVEDIELNAEMLMDLLDMEDVSSEHAENGQVAVEMFSQCPAGHFDAILMDLRMPVMDGLNTARTIRTLDHPDALKIPIIALTANCFEEDVIQTREAGMNAHLSKPVDAALLYETLGRLIEPRAS